MEVLGREKPRVWPYVGVFVFFWMASNVILPYLGLLYEGKGFSQRGIGILAGVFQFVVVLAALLVGSLEDRVGRPRSVLAVLLVGMVVSVFGIYGSGSYGITFLMVVVFGFCYAPVNGITDKALMGRLKEAPERYAKYRSGGTVGAGLGILLAAFLIRGDDFSAVVVGFCLALLPCLICVLFFGGDGRGDRAVPEAGDYLCFFRNRNSFPIYFAFAVWGLSESGVGTFQAILIRNAGWPVGVTSVFVAGAMVGEFIGFWLIPRLRFRLSYERWLALSFVLQFLRIFTLALIGKIPFLTVWVFQFLGGGSFAVIHSVITLVVDEVYPERVLYMAHGLKRVASNGVGNMLGLLILGQAFELGVGVEAYLLISLGAAVMAVYFLLGRKRFTV